MESIRQCAKKAINTSIARFNRPVERGNDIGYTKPIEKISAADAAINEA